MTLSDIRTEVLKSTEKHSRGELLFRNWTISIQLSGKEAEQSDIPAMEEGAMSKGEIIKREFARKLKQIAETIQNESNTLLCPFLRGVGAGFDFHAGTIKRAPIWVQKIGFEWLYRLFQDPGRLIKRYAITNVKYFLYLLLEKVDLG